MTLGLALLIIAVIYFSIISPGFRKFAAVAVIALIALGLIMILVLTSRNSEKQTGGEAARVQDEPAQPTPRPRKVTRSAKSVPHDRGAAGEVTDELTGFDYSSRQLETRNGHTFSLTRDGERGTAMFWHAGSPLHYVCTTAEEECLIENLKRNPLSGTREAVHGRMIR